MTASPSDFGLQGKAVGVTGASRGIGAARAAAYAASPAAALMTGSSLLLDRGCNAR